LSAKTPLDIIVKNDCQKLYDRIFNIQERKMTMTVFGYARVSTTEQELENQISTLKQNGVPSENIFAEHFTGTKKDRPQLNLLMQNLKSGDELIITKLDRLSRSVRNGIELVQELNQKGIIVNILNIGRIDETPTGKLILNIFFSFAEFERDMIVERTQEGKQWAKRNNPNYREGRPKRRITPRYEHAYELLQTNTAKQVSQMTGISERTLYRIKKQIEEKK
jgi:DNA invertase Pin-like site-specific DNA recombinase